MTRVDRNWSPAEGCFLIAVVVLVGEVAQVPYYPE